MPEEALVALVTVSSALATASERLTGAGCESPRLDVELLLGELLGLTRGGLVSESRRELTAPEQQRFDALLARREAREPVAYILGRKGFRHIELSVDPRVLIPRPETELLVEAGLGLFTGARVVDVGTGSGAVALALKDERPDLDVVGVDIDPGALAVATANAAALGLDVAFQRGDLLSGVGGDAVLANLPYVAADASLAPEITRYEPARALFAGLDGLDVIRRLVGQLAEVPFVALEIGFDQADAVAALLRDAGYARVEQLRDLAGHVRVITGRR